MTRTFVVKISASSEDEDYQLDAYNVKDAIARDAGEGAMIDVVQLEDGHTIQFDRLRHVAEAC